MDFDPEDHETDDQVTEEILDISLKIVEQLQDSSQAVDILKGEALSLNGLHNDDPVSRKKVTPQTDTNKKFNILSYILPTLAKNLIPIDNSKLKESAKRDFGPAISLLKMLKEDGATSGYKTIEYKEYDSHPEFPKVKLSGMMKMMEGAPPREYLFAPKKIVRLLRRIIANRVGLAMTKDAVDSASAKEIYEAIFTKSKIFGFIPNPLDLVPSPGHIIENWKEDKELGRQFLNGVNPVMIRVAKTVEEITQPAQQLVEHLGTERLQRLINDERLFYVSYDDLEDLEVMPHQAYPLPMNAGVPQDQPRYFYPATAVFVLSKDRKELDVLGIQLERTADATVYTREDCTENEWMFAKSSLATADSQFHEWVSHLGMTHLAMEPHIIAIHNTLRRHKHPVHAFVKPLCKDTLLLNWAARRTLAAPGKNSFGDYVTSVGTGQFLQLIQKKWESYNFFDSSGLPSELASRGFTEDFDMPEYLYREDGMKLWNAYGNFATDFINELYATDEDIANDKVLQEWAQETSDSERGAVPGFPETFDDKATVIKVLQTLMWMSSGLHAAVNMPQYDFYAYGPNKPLGCRAGVDEFRPDKDWIFSEFMPHIDIQEEVVSTTNLLTLPSEHCIDNLSENFKGVGKTSYDKFQAQLDKIGNDIEARNKANKDKGNAVYHYLHPSVVPASIDI